MADPTSWNPGQIDAMGRAVSSEAGVLASLSGRVIPPSTHAFGALLAPPATNAFPFTTDGVRCFLDRSGEAVGRMGAGLAYSAASYQNSEEQATEFANRIAGRGGAGGSQSGPSPVDITPRGHWRTAKSILGDGAGRGGDAFAGGNVASVLMPTALDWLNVPVAVQEMVATGLGFLAATLISYFPPFDDALEKLTGDPDAIRAFRSAMEALATNLGSHADRIDDSTRMAPGWVGDAADAYGEYATIQEACMRAAEALVDVIGPSVEGVAANTGQARKMVVAILVNVIEEIVRAAIPNLFWLKVALGFAFLPLGFIVSGAIIATILARFIAWVVEFLATEMQVIAQLMRDVAQQGSGYLGQIRQLGQTMERAGIALETGMDPGTGYGVHDGSIADSMLGTVPDPRDGSLVDLMAGDVPDGYSEVTDAETLAQLGLTPDMLADEGNGFRAHVYRDADGNYVVLFEGTDFEDPEQRDLLQENLPGGTGMGPQSEMAMRIAQAISGSHLQDQVIYAGHSLGGRLAAVAAMTSGNPAVTANAAGVSPAQIEYIAQANGMTTQEVRQALDSGLVRAYRTDDDILTGLQERYPIIPGLMPDAVGSTIDLPGDKEPVEGHGADNVQEQYNRQYGTGRQGSLTP